MSKPSRGATRYAAGKKKGKKRQEPRRVGEVVRPIPGGKPEPSQEAAEERSTGTVLQFRPRQREISAGRQAAGKVGPSARAFLKAVDYSYVYADLKLIGGLSVFLFGSLAVLSFFIR